MKVSRKVGRRKHSRSSSISRRRLRNKKSRRGYKKRYAKTQRGGARSRKYGDKRGKRFHRGGGPLATDVSSKIEMVNFSDESTRGLELTAPVFESTRDPELTTPVLVSTRDPVPTTQVLESTRDHVPTTDVIPSLQGCGMLPNDIFSVRKFTTKMENALYFEYERTDGPRHKLGNMFGLGKRVPGLFDVVILWSGYAVSKVFLLRRIKGNLKEDYDKKSDVYDKKFIIDYEQFAQHVRTIASINKPFTDIPGYEIEADFTDYINGHRDNDTQNYRLPKGKHATYTLPATKNNIANLENIRFNILGWTLSPNTRKFPRVE